MSFDNARYVINLTSPENADKSFVIDPYTADGYTSPISQVRSSTPTTTGTHSSMRLYGKGAPDYGERIAENFIHLMENFAGPVPPTVPLDGQLWMSTNVAVQLKSASSTSISFIVDGDFTNEFAAGDDFKVYRRLNPTADPLHYKIDTVSYDVPGDETTFVIDATQTTPYNITVDDYILNAEDERFIYGLVSQRELKVFNDVTSEWENATAVFINDFEPNPKSRGQLWYDTSVDPLIETPILKIYNGTDWIAVGDNYLPKKGGIMTGNIEMATGYEVTGLPATPSATGATSKEYVDDYNSTQDGTIASKLELENPNFVFPAFGGSIGWSTTSDLLELTGNSPTSIVLSINGKISDLEDPVDLKDAVNNQYLTASLDQFKTDNIDPLTDTRGSTLFSDVIGSGAFTVFDADNNDTIHNRLSVVEVATGGSSAAYLDKTQDDTKVGNIIYTLPTAATTAGDGIVFTDGIDTFSIYSYSVDASAGNRSQLILQSDGNADDEIVIRHTSGGLDKDITFGINGIALDSTNLMMLSGLAAPVDPNDATNKAYVDAAVSGSSVSSNFVAHTVSNNGGQSSIDVVMSPSGDLPVVGYPTVTVDDAIKALDYDKVKQNSPSIFGEITNTKEYDNASSSSVDNAFFIDGDFTNNFYVGMSIEISNSTFEAEDVLPLSYAIVSVAINPTNQFGIAGDHTTEYPGGNILIVENSTGNDNAYTIASSVFDSVNTIITVNEPVPDATVDGQVQANTDIKSNDGIKTITAVDLIGGVSTKLTVSEPVLALNSGSPIAPNGLITTSSIPSNLNGVATKEYVDKTDAVELSNQAVTGGATYTVPAYTVGENKLWIFVNGVKSMKDYGYSEVGVAGDVSTSITFITIPTTGRIEFLTVGQDI